MVFGGDDCMGKDELSIELINLIKSGENIAVEFKQATNALNKDVYDTTRVCHLLVNPN